MRFMLAFFLAAASATPALAQGVVGYPPDRSPFNDLFVQQGLTAYSGYFSGASGTAGVGPQAAPLVGLRYDARIGGPLYFTTRLGLAFSSRTTLDPSKPPATRSLGTGPAPLAMFDAGFTLQLTGQKSYRRLVPVLRAGVGLASDVGAGQDIGGFSVGTPFAFTLGGGVMYAPGGRYALRVEAEEYLFRLAYPTSYFTTAAGATTPILARSSSSGEWQHPLVLTLGVSVFLFR